MQGAASLTSRPWVNTGTLVESQLVRKTTVNLQERARIHVARGDPARRAAGRPDPPQLPSTLTPGIHLSPSDGACLMEAVSLLAGEPWSDAPRTTLPLLAHLARLVNDAMTADERQALLGLAHRLAGLTSVDPTIQPRIAAMVTRSALEWRPSPILAWMHRTALRHVALAEQPERPLAGLRRRLYLHGPAQRAVEASVASVLEPPGRRAASPARSALGDRRLISLLERAVEMVEEHAEIAPSRR
jgi:hypothetical protein